MKILWRKVLAGIAAFCMLTASAFPAGTAGAAVSSVKKYDDVSGHKYEEALLYVIENGLMYNTKSEIFPDNALTKGAACMSLNALLGAEIQYEGMAQVGNLKKGDSYYKTVSIGLNCGYLKQKKNGNVYNPLAKATYGYLADIFTNVLGFDMSERIVGSHIPSDTLTRAEYAVLLKELAPNIVSKNTKRTASGDVYVTSPNVILSNVSVDGNLIITDAVGSEEVTLINVEIEGKLIVRGGGENSIIITGKSKVPETIVKQVNYPVSIKSSRTCEVGTVQVEKGTKGFKLSGKVERLNVAAEDIKVQIGNVSVKTVEVSGKGAALIVTNEANIEAVAVTESAAGSVINIAGKVENINVAAKGTKIDVAKGGSVAEIKAEETAAGFVVGVAEGASVKKVASTAENTVVQGNGNVASAVLTGEGSSVLTSGTATTETPAATPVPTAAPSGGSSGGSTTTPSVSVTSVVVADDVTIEVVMSDTSLTKSNFSLTGTGYSNGVTAVSSHDGTKYVLTVNPLNANENYTLTVSKSGSASYVKGDVKWVPASSSDSSASIDVSESSLSSSMLDSSSSSSGSSESGSSESSSSVSSDSSNSSSVSSESGGSESTSSVSSDSSSSSSVSSESGSSESSSSESSDSSSSSSSSSESGSSESTSSVSSDSSNSSSGSGESDSGESSSSVSGESGLNESESLSLSTSISESESISLSISESESLSASISESESESLSITESLSVSISESESESLSISGSLSVSISESESESLSISESLSASTSESLSISESESLSASVNESISISERESASAYLSELVDSISSLINSMSSISVSDESSVQSILLSELNSLLSDSISISWGSISVSESSDSQSYVVGSMKLFFSNLAEQLFEFVIKFQA